MRSRITVSLPGKLVQQADGAAKRLGLRSRSATVERALELLVQSSRAREIDASLDAYYGTMSKRDRAEEAGLVRAFNRSQRSRDLDDEGT